MLLSTPKEGIAKLDVGTVYAYAAGFAHAVSNQDSVLISSYLSEEVKASIPKVLGGLPVPIRTAEVLSVTPPEDDRCISLTRFA